MERNKDEGGRMKDEEARPDLRGYLGQQLTVIVDRPLGSKHPDWNIWYPVNYGCVPGTVSGDGDPIDAYLLGVFEPVKEASGIVIAVVLRADDDEAKLVVAPADLTRANRSTSSLPPSAYILAIRGG